MVETKSLTPFTPIDELTQAHSSFVLGVIGAALVLRGWYVGGPDQVDRLKDVDTAVGLISKRRMSQAAPL